MIKVTLTENYKGFNICGTYDDLNELYDSISYILGEECNNLEEEDARLHTLGFMYDLRHAYQGDRYVNIKEEELTNFEKKYFHIKESKYLIYSFNYLIPQLLLDFLIVNYFKEKNNIELDSNYYVVTSFYLKAIESLSILLTKNQIKKIKNSINKKYNFKNFFSLWFDKVDIDFIYMKKSKVQKEMMHIINSVINYYDDEEYIDLKKKVLEYVKENNCRITDIEYNNYPKKIIW